MIGFHRSSEANIEFPLTPLALCIPRLFLNMQLSRQLSLGGIWEDQCVDSG